MNIDISKSEFEMLKQILTYPNDFKYPLGTKIVSDDPEFLNKEGLGGKWEQIEGAFIFGANDDYPADGVVRGETAHTHRLDGTAGAQIVMSGEGALYSIINSTILSYDLKTYKMAVSMSSGSYANPQQTPVVGYTNEKETMPPYIAKYMWIKTKLESETDGLLEVNV